MMKKLMGVITVLCLVAVMVLGTAGVVSAAPPENTGPQTWQLDSEQVTTPAGTVYQMERTGSTGDDNQSGSVAIAAGGNAIWMADEVAVADCWFTGTDPSVAAWVIELVTEAKWTSDGDTFVNNCLISLGEWDNTTGFSAFSTAVQGTLVWGGGNTYFLEVTLSSAPAVVHQGKYLAMQVTNNDNKGHTIYTGEDALASCVRSPEPSQPYPTPEMPTVALLGVGLLGLVGIGYLGWRKHKVTA